MKLWKYMQITFVSYKILYKYMFCMILSEPLIPNDFYKWYFSKFDFKDYKPLVWEWTGVYNIVTKMLKWQKKNILSYKETLHLKA